MTFTVSAFGAGCQQLFSSNMLFSEPVAIPGRAGWLWRGSAMNDRIDAVHRRPAAAPREGACRRDNSLATAIIGTQFKFRR
jgi:hypothetical protein